MKREGRQHGMVRSYCPIPSPLNPNPPRRLINKFDTPTTAGLFVKVAAKPTNHSKFTGRCGKPKCCDCHDQPVCKSKDKAKGSQKLKSTTDVSTDCRYMSWQLVDQTTNETKKSFDYSASGILDRLANSYEDYLDYDDDEYDEDVQIRSDDYDHKDWFFVQDNYVTAT
ncbi:Histone-lysine N-methyltransferase trithorax-like protein [Heracleum sosnowskyi]|uniref:Histone-lysine N-methyltransferase trithorax-like protein n=1 Tax=Heracleum sosnowskyi TaxID=360622 RepID=A0AAD8JIW9_9APIA|nr:Histone-lysine N-methyltransferase trithorax-like protein [Heracleum sosnowskyi]KAK1404339.1 Histone-lysine N-methyltransferase trithorax-like protein [Heracleum sosnowskyi]